MLVFVGCGTGYNEYSLLYAAVEAGATYAIGFKDSIDCSNANEWTKTFFEALATGYSIAEAARNASGNHPYGSDIGSYIIVYKENGAFVTIDKNEGG